MAGTASFSIAGTSIHEVKTHSSYKYYMHQPKVKFTSAICMNGLEQRKSESAVSKLLLSQIKTINW